MAGNNRAVEQKAPPINKPKAQVLLDEYKTHLSARRNFESYWQSLHDYFYIEGSEVNTTYSPGNELYAGYLYDSTTLEASDVFASGFMNYLTPPTSKWFRLRHSDKALNENKDVANFLEEVAEEVNHVLNKSNFYGQIFPSYKSSGVYGTSLVLEEEDFEDNARFYNMPLKQCILIEDAKGRPMKYYIEFEYTAEQAKTRWGDKALSTDMIEELRKGASEKKYKFLLYIGYRYIREVQKTDKFNMPIEALWINVDNKTIIDEGGYNEFPAMAHRFNKRPFIAWGYSPAMKALPFSRLLNAIAKTNLRTMMKHTDPPIAVPDNAFLMPFNMNPRAINVYNKDAMAGGAKDLFAFGNFGNPEVGMNAVEYYSMKVKNLMYNDIFLAFQNIKKEMNNPEIIERINEKMTLLGPAVGRYISEVLNPLVIRTIGILWRNKRLPFPPDALIMDPNYEIDFVGLLAQAQRRSELNTMMTGLEMVRAIAEVSPEVIDKIDPDKVVDETWNITGAPVSVLRDDAEIKKIRENRAEEAARVQQLALMGAGAQAAKDATQAEANISKSQEGKK